MAITYILFSEKTGKYYTGSTRAEVAYRISAHNNGKTRSTKAGRPWVLVYEEYHESYSEAQKREMFLKSGVGRKWLVENLVLPRRGGGAV